MGRTGHIGKLLQHPAFTQPVQHTRKRINMLTVRMLETVFAVPQRHTRLFQLTPVRRQTARKIRRRIRHPFLRRYLDCRFRNLRIQHRQHRIGAFARNRRTFPAVRFGKVFRRGKTGRGTFRVRPNL
ncbi:Uncharacterised protein [Neisseria meningitidis]|nr:Uncharacterised protein [Neisseria meningitidis]